jgi:hypothetical protein
VESRDLLTLSQDEAQAGEHEARQGMLANFSMGVLALAALSVVLYVITCVLIGVITLIQELIEAGWLACVAFPLGVSLIILLGKAVNARMWAHP